MDNKPPEPVTSDYVEVATLIIMFILGGPVNLAAYSLLGEKQTTTRMDLLKKHLNYSDLVVLFIYAPSRICWLLTYDWRGGDFMCKSIKFLHSLAFQISSNIIICIALDRLFSVLWPLNNTPKKGLLRTKVMLASAWVLAAAASSPQYFFYGTYAAYVDHPSWEQCIQQWQKERWTLLLSNDKNVSVSQLESLSYQESVYSALHLVSVFWLPSFIVLLSYLSVSCWLLKNSHLSDTTKSIATKVYRRAPAKSPEESLHKSQEIAAIEQPADNGEKTSNDSSSSSDREQFVVQIEIPNVKRVKRKAIRVSCLLVSVYLLCWLPYMSLSMLQLFYPAKWFKLADSIYFLFGLIVFNSVINPFLYGMFGKMRTITRSG